MIRRNKVIVVMPAGHDGKTSKQTFWKAPLTFLRSDCCVDYFFDVAL